MQSIYCLFFLAFVLVSYASKKPNIIFILTDDQDYMLAGWNDKSYELIGKKGIEFYSYYAHSPICCVSRSAILTGRYMHNIRETSFPGICSENRDCGCMYINTDSDFEMHNIAVYMQDLGYATGYFGKYLNSEALTPYCSTKGQNNTAAPSWDHFSIQCDITYFNDTWSVNGKVSKFPDYTIAKIGNDSVKWLNNILSNPNHKPVFAILAPHAPHAPYTPAPWYVNATIPGSNPVLPSYNYSAMDHPEFIADIPPLNQVLETELEFIFKQRARTILSVDDVTTAVLDVLKEYEELDNTYIFFSSDNGYHLGEFRLNAAKTHPYEFDIRVPFGVRGPNIIPETKGFLQSRG